MSKWTIAAAAAVLILLVGNMARFTDKGTGAADVAAQALQMTEADCIDRYSVTAATEAGALAARKLCAEHANFFTETPRRELIECMLPRIQQAGTEAGMNIGIVSCQEQVTASR